LFVFTVSGVGSRGAHAIAKNSESDAAPMNPGLMELLPMGASFEKQCRSKKE
jgi:hypothetical protein